MELSLLSSIGTVEHVNKSDPASADDPSPLRNVPNEVLSRIFVLICDRPIRIKLLANGTTTGIQSPYRCQVVLLLQVCSKWRELALSESALWSKVEISFRDTDRNYAQYLSHYRTWIDRAGARPLTVTIRQDNKISVDTVRRVFYDFVLPFQIRLFDVGLQYNCFSQLSDLPRLNVEELVISLISIRGSEDRDIAVAPSFMEKARGVCLRTHSLDDPSAEWFKAMLKQLTLPLHQLRSFECHSRPAPLASLLGVLQQMPLLERCCLTIYVGVYGHHMAGISIPSLRYLELSLQPDVDPTTIIPLIAAPNITALSIYSWSKNTYDTLQKRYNLHGLQEFSLHGMYHGLCISQVLTDASMVHKLFLHRSDVNVEADVLDRIASGKLGPYLSSVALSSGTFTDKAICTFLTAIETRQKIVNAMVTMASNWKEMPTGIKYVELWGLENPLAHGDRKLALKALGTAVTLFKT